MSGSNAANAATAATAANAVIAAVVLAAGRSDRFGDDNKLLADLAGRPMIAHVMEQVARSKARPVVVVTGRDADRVKARIVSQALDVNFVHNAIFDQGLSTSLHAGIAALDNAVDGALILLGDMPLITAEIIDALMAQFAPGKGKSIVVPVHERQQGNPVLWGAEHFAGLLALKGDAGAKSLLEHHRDRQVCIELGPAVLRDIDHKAALAALNLELG
jgi:molybdenum cofactor cytidylyltransferase